jgi:hypothetical protein
MIAEIASAGPARRVETNRLVGLEKTDRDIQPPKKSLKPPLFSPQNLSTT